jgi:hypothetical protein
MNNYEEGGKAEIANTAEEGLEVISKLNDGHISAEDVKDFNEFMGGLTGRISEISANIARLEKIPNAKDKLEGLRRKRIWLAAIRASVNAGTEGKRKKSAEKTKSAASHDNKPRIDNNPQKNNGFVPFIKNQEQERLAAEAVIKLVKAGKDPSKALQTIGYNEQGNKIKTSNSAFANLFKKDKNQVPKKRRSFMELRGIKTKKVKKEVKRTKFNPTIAKQIQSGKTL